MPSLDDMTPRARTVVPEYLKDPLPAPDTVIHFDPAAPGRRREGRLVLPIHDSVSGKKKQADLSKWSDRPGLQHALYCFLDRDVRGKATSHANSVLKYLRPFKAFLDAADRSDVVDVSRIDQKLLKQYAGWLDRQKSSRSGRGRSLGSDDLPLKGLTKVQRYNKVVALLEFCRRDSRFAGTLPPEFHIPASPWSRAYLEVEPREALSHAEFGRIRAKCIEEVEVFLARLELGTTARRDATTSTLPADNRSVKPYKNWPAKLNTVLKIYGDELPSMNRMIEEHPGLARSLRPPYGDFSDLLTHLHFTMRSILPFVILIAMRTIYNPETVLKLEWNEIRREHPLFGEDRWLVMGDKPRAGRRQFRSFPARIEDLSNPVRLLKEIERFSEPVRHRLPRHLRDRVFAFAQLKGEPFTPFTAFDDMATQNSTLQFHLKDFQEAHDLPYFTLSTIRATAADLFDLASGGDIVAKQRFFGHASVDTTFQHYHSPLAKREAREALATFMNQRERYLGTDGFFDPRNGRAADDRSAVTPGFRCLEPLSSPQKGEQSGRPCMAFGACPTCALAFVDLDDPRAYARLVQLRARIVEAKMAPERWLCEWQPRLAALDGFWLPDFPVNTKAQAAALVDLPPIPEIE